MNIEETSLPGVLLITPKIYSDNRGAFWETWNHKTFEDAGLPCTWVQDNFSVFEEECASRNSLSDYPAAGKTGARSARRGTRCCCRSAAQLAIFGKHVAVELSGENGRMLWIPEGFGHGFLVLSEQAGFAYKVTDYYNPKGERTIVWNDPELAIQWPLKPEEAIVSEKDAKGATLATAEVFA